MSYILDALRRAEAERERGGVPGVHSEQFPAMPEDDDTPRRSNWLVVAIVVLSLSLTATLAWNLFGGRSAAPAATTVASGAVTPAAAPPVVPSATQALPSAMPAPSAATAALPASTSASAPAASAPSLAVAPAPRTPRERRRTTTKSRDDDAPSARTSDRVYAESELPAEARRALPRLAFGGSSYSSAASSRMVIWNGRVFHEGDTIAPDVVLRRIDRKSAQLAVKGLRVDVPF